MVIRTKNFRILAYTFKFTRLMKFLDFENLLVWGYKRILWGRKRRPNIFLVTGYVLFLLNRAHADHFAFKFNY